MALGTEIRAVARKIAQAARAAATAQSSSQGFRYGTVTSTELGVAQVVVDGNDGPTPCHATAATVSAGDRVAIRIDANGHGEILRNFTDPAASSSSVAEVGGVAAEAAAVAAATGQHFWDDDNGVHVTQSGRDAYEEAASGPNLLANSLGILLRMAANNLLSITSSAVAFYDGAGNADANVTAQFSSILARIGKSAGKHTDIDADGLKIFNGSTLLGNFLATGAQVGPTNGPHLIIRTDATNYNQSLTGYYIFLDFYMGSTKVGVLSSTYTSQGIKVLSIKTQTAELYVNNTDAKIFTTNATVSVNPSGVAMGPNVSVGNNLTVGNNVSATGSITANGHGSAIGTTHDANTSEKTLASGTPKNLGSIELAAGTWLLVGGANFEANATGRRLLTFSTTSASTGSAAVRQSGTSVMASPYAGTYLKAMHITKITSATTYYLVAEQGSGTSLTATGYIRAVRIA